MPPSRKRKADTDARPACKYGEKCYRKSEEHLKKFRHPKKKVENNRDDNDEKADRSTASPVRERQSNKRCSNEASANEMQGTSHRCELPESPENVQQSIKQKFLVEMPQDFYDFWAFCESLNKHNPEDALQNLLGLHLVGPFDVVAGKLRNGSVKNKDEFLRHWRYFYDPPEMLTVIRGNDQTMYHLGYFRDDPNEMPVFVASNTVTDGCKITKVAGNLFAAVSKEIAKALKECEDDELRAELRKLNGSLVEFAEQKGHSLSESSKKRPKPQAPTFHGAGIVVPVDRKTEVGYRPLPLSDGKDTHRFVTEYVVLQCFCGSRFHLCQLVELLPTCMVL